MRRTEKNGPGGASLAGRVLAALLGVVLSAGLVPARGLAEAVVELGGPVASAAETIGEIEAADGFGAPEAGRAAATPPRAAEGTDAGDGEDEGVTLEAQDEEVTYLEASLDASGAVVYTRKVVPSGYTLVTSSATKTFVDGGWYVVDGLVTVSNSIEINGNVNLVLKDGCECRVNDGIHVVNGNVLNVYAQSEGESAGLLKARTKKARSYQIAAIGGKTNDEKGGSVIIHGGRIDADSSGRKSSAIGGGAPGGSLGADNEPGYDGGAVTVYGGVVEATSDKGFAIGGGAPDGNYAYGSGGTVAVYGGTVTAKRTDDGTGSPAIGGGDGSDATAGTLYVGPGLRAMGSGDGGSTYDVLIANGPCTNLEYASRTPYMRIEPAPEPPLAEIDDASWQLGEPLAG